MKSEIFFKQVDFAIQILAFIVPVFCIQLGTFDFPFWYIVVGLVQVASCGINATELRKNCRHKCRRYYEYFLFVLLVTFPIWFNVILIMILLLFIISPFVALWYLWFSYRELQMLKQIATRKLK